MTTTGAGLALSLLVLIGSEEAVPIPAFPAAIVDGGDRDAGLLRQGASTGQSTEAEGATRIVRLLKPCRPTAIVLGVRAIVVDAFKHQPFRTAAHVVNEVRERTPAVIDRDSATTVSREAFIVWVGASSDHRQPDVILRRVSQSVPEVSDRCPNTGRLSIQTSTATSGPARQILAKDDTFRAAGTSAAPSDAPVSMRRLLDNQQTAEARAYQRSRGCSKSFPMKATAALAFSAKQGSTQKVFFATAITAAMPPASLWHRDMGEHGPTAVPLSDGKFSTRLQWNPRLL